MPGKVLSNALMLSLVLGAAMAIPAVSQEEVKLGGRRIIGGEKTDIKHHQWQVALHVRKSGETYLCGGSIISGQWVLTASHCFEPTSKSRDVRVKSGVTNYLASGNWAHVERIIIHEKYDSSTHVNDIALIKIKSHNGRVIPLMPANGSLRVGQLLEVTGWGVVEENGETSGELLKARVPYVENATCNQPRSYDGAIRPGMMCAGFREGGIDSCQGDSGGPLVWRSLDGPVLVGVVSFGDGCARKLKYGVYTRVAEYRSWISEAIAADRN